MRLANGIVLDKEKTFGVLKFSALRHEVRAENDDGSTSEEITRRTYDLKMQCARTYDTSINPCGHSSQGLSVQFGSRACQSRSRYGSKCHL